MALGFGQNDIGKTMYLAMEHPATNDAAGFEALAWVKVNGIQSIGERGIAHEGIDVPDLQTGFTSQVKGGGAGMDTTLVFRKVDDDTGQMNMKTMAEGDDGNVSIKLVEGSDANQEPVAGDPVEYAWGIAHSYRPREASISSYKGFSVIFRNNALWIDTTESA